MLAVRLSQEPTCQVALIEAGGEDLAPALSQPNQLPLLWERAEGRGYATTLQTGYKLRNIPCPRSKVHGGTSAINAMIYIRGDAQDYDHWQELGNPGWGWQDVLTYFLKSEDQQRGASAMHGAGGPLTMADQISPHRLSQAFVDAALADGHKRNHDFNGESSEGAGLYQVTVRHGEWCSITTAFLQPARSCNNLHIITHARTLRVNMEGDRATGVD